MHGALRVNSKPKDGDEDGDSDSRGCLLGKHHKWIKLEVAAVLLAIDYRLLVDLTGHHWLNRKHLAAAAAWETAASLCSSGGLNHKSVSPQAGFRRLGKALLSTSASKYSLSASPSLSLSFPLFLSLVVVFVSKVWYSFMFPVILVWKHQKQWNCIIWKMPILECLHCWPHVVNYYYYNF